MFIGRRATGSDREEHTTNNSELRLTAENLTTRKGKQFRLMAMEPQGH